MEEEVADLLNRSLTIDIPQPPVSVGSGEEYEVIGVPGPGLVLPPRLSCARGKRKSLHQKQTHLFLMN